MKKILFLENKEDRKEKLTVDLKKYDFVTHIFGDEKCNKILDEFCSNKNLVKFSGNTTYFYLDKSLQLNPKILYENIESFFKAYQHKNSNMLMLALGEKCSLNILLNTLEKLNIWIEDNKEDKVNISIFRSKTGLLKIKEVSLENYKELFVGITTNTIEKEQMQEIAQKLQKLIKEKAND